MDSYDEIINRIDKELEKDSHEGYLINLLWKALIYFGTGELEGAYADDAGLIEIEISNFLHKYKEKYDKR